MEENNEEAQLVNIAAVSEVGRSRQAVVNGRTATF